MRIADFVVDSKIGPLDRTLGFVFGVARGVLIAVVMVVFGQWLLGPSLPDWAAESKSLPMLADLGDSLIAALPPDLEEQVTDILQRGIGGEDATATEPPPAETDSTDTLENGTPPEPVPNA
jgi:membrane protein required for colicin V production